MDVSDIFLLLAYSVRFYSDKVLIKKLYSSSHGLDDLFTKNKSLSDLSVLAFELERLKRLRLEISKLDINVIKADLEEKQIKFLPLSDSRYPQGLKNTPDPPVGLFYRGNVGLLSSSRTVSIVGTRLATNYGLNNATKIASLLSSRDITVVSGLAAGIDTSAHLGSFKGGKTIAVLGTGIDVIFPACNKQLFYDIIDKKGLIVSEYLPGTEGIPWNFPQRNRIVSALSDAVIVIEGDLDSGALITARFAIKQGKPLFALPGPIDASTSNGPNLLIKSRVAELLTSVNDVLEKIGLDIQTKLDLKDEDELNDLSKLQKDIYSFLSSTSTSFDSLISKTNLSVQELTKHLSILELKGLIQKTNDGGYVRC